MLLIIIFFLIFNLRLLDAKEVVTPAISSFSTLTIPIVDRPLTDATVKSKFYGYIKLDVYLDTRQVVGLRNDQVMFYPAPKKIDPVGRDINARPQFHMSVIESRCGAALIGPVWDKVSTLGVLEIDFRGPTEETTHGLRLRYLFGKVEWPHSNFLFGLFAHPLYLVDCTPGVISGNSGAPFETLNRNPQLRLTYRKNKFEIVGAALAQTDFLSSGPLGLNSEYLAHSVIPELAVSLRLRDTNYLVGITADFKRLSPRLETDKRFKTFEHIDSFIAETFFGYDWSNTFIRAKLIYAQNAADQAMISGYGVRSINPVTDHRCYTNTAVFSSWLDAFAHWCDKKIETGLFIAGAKNLGAQKSLFINPQTKLPIIFTIIPFAQNIKYITRVSPRFIWTKDPLRIGLELEWTRAAFGQVTQCAKVINAIPVNNVRFLAAFYYVF